MNFKYKNLELLSIFLVTITLFLFFFLLVYPGIDDFSYYHMGTAILIENSGYVGSDCMNVGFYILTVIISMITNISYDHLPTFPILLFPIIFLFISVLKNLNLNTTICSLLLVIYITQSRNNYYGMFPHDVGLIITLLVFLLAIFRLKLSNRNQQNISILLILSLIAVNLLSYKHTFLTISFIVFLQVIEWITDFRVYFQSNNRMKKFSLIALTEYITDFRVYFQSNNRMKKFSLIALIGIVFIFSFNHWVYGTFFPIMKSAAEFSTSSGIDKLLSAFFQKYYDPMSEYHFFSPNEIIYAHLVWIILIFLNLFLCFIIIFHKFKRNMSYSINEKVIFSLGLSSTISLLIYSKLGTADISFLILTSIIGYSLTLQFPRHYVKKILTLSIALLLVLNIYMAVDSFNKDFHTDVKDQNQFEHLKSFSNWYIKNGLDETDKKNNGEKEIVTFTDFFTDSYLFKKIAEKNTFDLYQRDIFSRSQVLFLLNAKVDTINFNKNQSYRYLINYKENRFVIFGWEVFKSWSYFRDNLNRNPYLNKIYSSGSIDFLILSDGILF